MSNGIPTQNTFEAMMTGQHCCSRLFSKSLLHVCDANCGLFVCHKLHDNYGNAQLNSADAADTVLDGFSTKYYSSSFPDVTGICR